jgi:23S rRNA pseudouridine1911/1915/1917 synthase
MPEEFFSPEEGTLEDISVSSFEGYSIGQIRRAISSGAITVNGVRAAASDVVLPGDLVSFDTGEEEAAIEPLPFELPVLFEDDHLLAISKPAGVPVVPERDSRQWPFMGMLLYHKRSCAVCGPTVRYRVVHRLDRDTTGAVVLAKSAAVERALSRGFAGREVRKRYLAIVRGEPRESSGTIAAAIGPGGGKRLMAVRDGGKESVTEWRVAERFRGFALLEVFPRTGRTHQIRVHLSYVGMPLAVDEMYGGGEAIRLSEFKRIYKGSGEERPLIARLTLHCAGLEFPHPVTGERVTIEAPLPGDMERTLKALRRWAARHQRAEQQRGEQ